MPEITKESLREAGLTMADVARKAEVPYFRMWRQMSGGGNFLRPDEVDRLRRVLEARSQPA